MTESNPLIVNEHLDRKISSNVPRLNSVLTNIAWSTDLVVSTPIQYKQRFAWVLLRYQSIIGSDFTSLAHLEWHNGMDLLTIPHNVYQY